MSERLPENQGELASGPDRRLIGRPRWDEQLDEYARFVRERKRIPGQRAADPKERALNYWLQYQRASLRNGLLLASRAARLDWTLPGWNGRPPGGSEMPSPWDHGKWNSRFGQLLKHLGKHGKLPVMGMSSSPEEYLLGKWISRQRHALKMGSLRPDRAAILDRFVPDWRGRSK